MSEWISVEDRLPEKNTRVWAHYEGAVEHSGATWRRNGEHDAIWWGDQWAPWCERLAKDRLVGEKVEEIITFDVTHWMPLPEPPEDTHE